MKELHLKKGIVLVSDRDYYAVKNYSWVINGLGYVKAQIGGRQVYLHRYILSAPSTSKVDHISGDKLDNRRRNLRYATQSENLQNSRKKSQNTSGYKGISYVKSRGVWQATICKNYHIYFLGYFDIKEDAARAYNRGAKKYFGRFAKLNQIGDEI